MRRGSHNAAGVAESPAAQREKAWFFTPALFRFVLGVGLCSFFLSEVASQPGSEVTWSHLLLLFFSLFVFGRPDVLIVLGPAYALVFVGVVLTSFEHLAFVLLVPFLSFCCHFVIRKAGLWVVIPVSLALLTFLSRFRYTMPVGLTKI